MWRREYTSTERMIDTGGTNARSHEANLGLVMVTLKACSASFEWRKMKIGSIVVRCYEFDKMLAFWRDALHYVPRERASGGWVVLRDPEGRGPNVSLDRVPEPFEPIGKTSRVHLDLYTNDQEAEVERLIEIGATLYPQEYHPDDDFIVLEDPDGNRFCVVQAPDGG